MVARIKASIGLIRRPGFWQPGDSLILGRAHRGLVIKRVRDRHLDENDIPFRVYTSRYNTWKRSQAAAIRAHAVQVAAQAAGARKKPSKKSLAALDAAKAFFDAIPEAGPLPVDLTLTGKHLDGIEVVSYDEGGWVLQTDAVDKDRRHYSGFVQMDRPHLGVSPSDRKALTGIAMKIIRRRARSFKGGKAPR